MSWPWSSYLRWGEEGEERGGGRGGEGEGGPSIWSPFTLTFSPSASIDPDFLQTSHSLLTREPPADKPPEDKWKPPADKPPADKWEPPADKPPEDKWEPPADKPPEDKWKPPADKPPEDKWEPPTDKPPEDKWEPPEDKPLQPPADTQTGLLPTSLQSLLQPNPPCRPPLLLTNTAT